MHTQTKFLFQSDPDEEKAQHVSKQMKNSSMQPYTSKQTVKIKSNAKISGNAMPFIPDRVSY